MAASVYSTYCIYSFTVPWTFVAALAEVQQEATENRDSGVAASVHRTDSVYSFVVPWTFVAAEVQHEATENRVSGVAASGCLGLPRYVLILGHPKP